MTLKEKICRPFGGLKIETANELEKIADEYAIEFVNWISFTDYSTIDNTTKELLEIFKKENGF